MRGISMFCACVKELKNAVVVRVMYFHLFVDNRTGSFGVLTPWRSNLVRSTKVFALYTLIPFCPRKIPAETRIGTRLWLW